MKTARVPLRLEESLVAQIDDARGDVSRTRWIERAIESALTPPLDEQVAVTRARISTARASADAKRAVRPIPKGKR